jgi:hypothetical protein
VVYFDSGVAQQMADALVAHQSRGEDVSASDGKDFGV